MRHAHVLPVTLLVLACELGCSSAYRGAVLVDPSEVPRGRLIESFERRGCVPIHGSGDAAQVDYVLGATGRAFLVERTPASSWLLLTNVQSHGESIRFQAIRDDGARELIEYRFPTAGDEDGVYVRTTMYSPPKGGRHQFTAVVTEPMLTCQLRQLTRSPKTRAQGNRDTKGGFGTGWGFDMSSFQIGDSILVDMGGRTIDVLIQKTSDTAFLVSWSEGPKGGMWILPSQVVGTRKNLSPTSDALRTNQGKP